LPSPQTWQGQTLPDSPAWRLASNPLTVTGDDGNSKTYFAWQYGKEALRGAMSCFDWNTQDYCAGIPQVRYWYHINEAESADMGYAYDGSCMIGVSKQGYLWSFNPNTGETPCRVARTKFTATFNMANYYCDGQNHAFNWQNAHLAKSSMFDFQKFNVRVLDQPDGQEQAYSDIKQNPLDLSALSPGQFGSLFFDVDTVIWSSSPWSGSTYGPRVAVQADADNVQYCFTTRPKTVVEGMACDVSKLTTISSAVFKTTSDTLSSTDPSHINYQQPSNVQCFKDLSVSITPDRSTVGNDQLVTYAITINNKANADPQNRGQVQGAQFEFELPSGMTFESATNGGSLQGNKVVWANQTVEPGQQQNLSVSIRTPQASVDGQNSSQFAVLASAIFEDDTYQDDNSATSSQVNFIDNAAPVISNLTQSFANPRQPATLNFSVHVTDDVSVHDVELLKDGVSLGQMAVGGSPGQYTMLFTDQVAGTYQYTVRATDNASPQAVTISSPLIISIGDPNVAPQILNFEKTSGQDGIKAPGSVSFLARVEDDYSNPSVKLYRNNEVVSTLTKINSGLPNNNNYSATVNALAQGTHEFKLVVTDGEDSLMVVESSVISVTVLPANTAPVISNISQTSSSLIAPATITMVATVTDDYGLSKVELLGNSHEVVGQMQATGVANQYSITLTN
ncbi:hypothetical protein KDA11_03580, partial [Candidatus Saccharibacteria bacterium]|nr:hypothetical protein [Candidatus Saccharibacteria bacterium]